MRKIPFSPPDISQEEIDEVSAALRSGWITTGPRTKEFEKQIAAYCGVSHAVCLNSATAALELTLRALGIGPGDEVITSAYTYTASASPIVHVGATPVLVDTAKDSFEMDDAALSNAITEKTKAVIPVDIGGMVCDFDRIFAIVEEKRALFRPANEIQKQIGRVAVVADGAHSFGSVRKGQHSGSIADFTTFSFHAVKNLTTAEGGAVVWRDELGLDGDALYKDYMLMSLHGQSKDALAKTQVGAWEYDVVAPLYKCNMTDIMAALGLAQLKRYPALLERRREIVRRYDALLPQEIIRPAHLRQDMTSDCHLYLARIPGKTHEQRSAVIMRMAERGVACNVHYKPLPLLTAYRNLGFRMEDYPNAYAQFENEITLPLHTLLSDEDVAYVCETLKGCL